MKNDEVKNLVIRPAVKKDCLAMKDIIKVHANEGQMLAKTISQLISLLPNYVVAEVDGTIVGVCGFKIWPADGVELISSAVTKEFHDRGIGSRLNRKCIEIARALGFDKFFVLTKRDDFYRGLGFREVPKTEFTSKVSSDCIFCRENEAEDPEEKIIKCEEKAMKLETREIVEQNVV